MGEWWAPKRVRQFEVRSFLESGGVEKETIEFPANAVSTSKVIPPRR